MSMSPDNFTDCYTFLDKLSINSDVNTVDALALDFQVLPQLIMSNLNAFPKFFKMFYPECYVGADQDMHL